MSQAAIKVIVKPPDSKYTKGYILVSVLSNEIIRTVLNPSQRKGT